MKKYIYLAVGILFFVASSISNAQDTKQVLDTQKMMEDLNKNLKEAEVWVAKQRTIARERQQQCLDAFGHKKFCSCLNEELHWILGFDSYIRIITAPTTGAASDSSPDERMAIESVYKAREKCVGNFFIDGK